MSLKLNTSREAYQEYQEFYGRNTEQMPKLIADSRVPMSVSGLMQRRLDVRNSDDKIIKSAWMDNYFDTGDAVVYHPDGRVKIVWDSEDLRNMTPDTPRNGGALIITPKVYETLQGEEFEKGKIGKTGEWMSRKDVKSHPVWKVLARDQALLNDYADYIFGEYQARFTKNTPLEDVRAMGVSLGSASGNTPEMRAWYVGRPEYGSDAYGRSDLGDGGRFVGIASEALGAQSKGVSNIKTYTMADLQTYDAAVKGLEATVKPELLKPFAALRKKL
jgi:hypothetical protein